MKITKLTVEFRDSQPYPGFNEPAGCRIMDVRIITDSDKILTYKHYIDPDDFREVFETVWEHVGRQLREAAKEVTK